MRIGPVETEREGESVSVAADLTLDGQTDRVYFRTKDVPLAESIEAFAGIALMACMATGRDLLLDRPVSARWLKGIEASPGKFSSWRPEFSEVRLLGAVPQPLEAPPGRGAGVFFSGGLDSFYTTLKHKDEITHLVLMHGFDFPLTNERVRRRVSDELREAADALGKEFVEIETNFRSFNDRWVPLRWAYGALRVAVAHVLSPVIGRIYVPSAGGRDQGDPWEIFPELDAMWSTEAVELCREGGEANRARRAEYIAQSDVALKCLRVCWRVGGGAYNCGRCEKCIRTMLNLYAAGALERCATFPPRVSPKLVYRMKIRDEVARLYARQNLEALEAKGLDPRLRLALRRVTEDQWKGGRFRGNIRWFLDSLLWHVGWRP